MSTYTKKWEDLDITDDFIFSKFMRNKEICKDVLEILLPFSIGNIEYVEYQKIIDVGYDAKGIRLDVYVKGEDKVYNVEMQIGNTPDLAKRCRYYESLIDIDLLEKGEKYRELKESYVIFICTFDPFGKDLPCYTFKSLCQEDNTLALGDGRHEIFFNAKAYIKDNDVHRRNFLAFVNGEEIKDPIITKFSEQIDTIKDNKEWRMDYMNLALKFQEAEERGEARGRLEGMLEGLSQGRLEAILEMAKNFLDILDDKTIAMKTGLSVDKVEELRKEQEKSKTL